MAVGDDPGDFYLSNNNLLFEGRNNKYYYWQYENNQPVRKYEFPYDHNVMEPVDGQYFVRYTTNETGTELAQLDKNSVNYLTEIIKGPEGILLAGMTYFNGNIYALAFTGSNGWQVWKINKKVEAVLSAEPLKNDFSPVVYPNPVIDRLTLAGEKSFSYHIYTAAGQQIQHGNLSPGQPLNLEGLNAGVYIIRLSDRNTVHAKKFVVIK